MTTPRRLPLVPAYVTVNGEPHGSRSVVWAGLRWGEAERSSFDWTIISVPFQHPDEPCVRVWTTVRPRYDGWRFVLCRSGAWMLERIETADPIPSQACDALVAEAQAAGLYDDKIKPGKEAE